MALRYEKLTGKIIKCLFEVHNEVGIGLDEETYHRALVDCFARKGIPVISKERKYLTNRGIQIKGFELDLLAFEKIILALKAVQSDFLQTHYVQIISELKLWQKDLGMLINFGRPKVEFIRIPFNEKKKELDEDYFEIKSEIDDPLRQLLARIREAIHFVFEAHGLGFGRVVYLKIIRAELQFRGIAYQDRIPIPVTYRGKSIRTCKTKAICIDNQILCSVTSIQDQITFFDTMRMKTYLKHSNYTIGLLVNFGKSKLEIKAINQQPKSVGRSSVGG